MDIRIHCNPGHNHIVRKFQEQKETHCQKSTITIELKKLETSFFLLD